jgi:hypothetical protein
MIHAHNFIAIVWISCSNEGILMEYKHFNISSSYQKYRIFHEGIAILDGKPWKL